MCLDGVVKSVFGFVVFLAGLARVVLDRGSRTFLDGGVKIDM